MLPKAQNPDFEVPAKLYRIGEVVRYTPFSRQTIHNYTIMGLIREVEWTEGGHRLYDESVFERLSRIMHLKKSKTLSEIRRLLTQEERTNETDLGRQNTSITSPQAGPNTTRVVSEDERTPTPDTS